MDIFIIPIMADTDYESILGDHMLSDMPNDDMIFVFSDNLPESLKFQAKAFDKSRTMSKNGQVTEPLIMKQIMDIVRNLHAQSREIGQPEEPKNKRVTIFFDMRDTSTSAEIPRSVINSIARTIHEDLEKGIRNQYDIVPITQDGKAEVESIT